MNYNGWSNYETWLVNLWISNDSSEYWYRRTQEIYNDAESDHTFTREERAALTLADAIKDEHEENSPEVTGIYADMINAALREVNWHEIATALLEDVEVEA